MLTGQFASVIRLDLFDALKMSVPSPLAGEGQGEGAPITGERSETSTQYSKLRQATIHLAECCG